MRATDFEYRHQLLLHELIIGTAVLTYLVDKDDIVWRLIKGESNVRVMERSGFALATLIMGISACLCTVARARSGAGETTQLDHSERSLPYLRLRYLGDFLYAIALGSLVPLSGFCLLVIGEGIRLFRLSRRDGQTVQGPGSESDPAKRLPPQWARAFRQEALKWGLFLTMIVFSITLIDRVAEVLIALTILLWAILNVRIFGGSRDAAAP